MSNSRRHSSDVPTEYSPLLGRGAPHAKVPKVHSNRTIVNLLLLVNLMVSSAGGLVSIPQARLAEDVLCHEYYHQMASLDVPIDEDLCKLEPIQSELAVILAVSGTFAAVTGFVSAYPWSLLADKIGRKPVLSIALTGILLGCSWTVLVLFFRTVFPIRMLWLESLGQFIGGGAPTLMAMLMSMLADATTEQERAVVFLRQHVVSVCGNFVAPAVSSLIMSRLGPWPPYLAGTGLLAASAIAVMFVPETLRPNHPPPPTTGNAGPSSPGPTLKHSLGSSLSIFTSRPLVLLLLTGLGSLPVFFSTTSFVALFISKRYGARLYQGGYVQTAYGAASMTHTLLVLPWLCRRLMRPGAGRLRPADERRRDLALARCSAAVTALAALVLGLAPTLPAFAAGLALLALGSGCNSLVKSLVSCCVDPVHRSRLFGVVGMVEILGAVYAQPMLAALFSLGMRMGGGWIGAPYFGVSALVAGVTGLLLFVRVPERAGSASSSSLSSVGVVGH